MRETLLRDSLRVSLSLLHFIQPLVLEKAPGLKHFSHVPLSHEPIFSTQFMRKTLLRDSLRVSLSLSSTSSSLLFKKMHLGLNISLLSFSPISRSFPLNSWVKFCCGTHRQSLSLSLFPPLHPSLRTWKALGLKYLSPSLRFTPMTQFNFGRHWAECFWWKKTLLGLKTEHFWAKFLKTLKIP